MLKTRAFILSTLKYRESSLILEMFTEEKGRASFIISGVRTKTKKHTIGVLQAGNWVEVLAYFRPGAQLNRIKEVRAMRLYKHIPFSVTKRAILLFCTELAHKLIKSQEQHIELFEFLRQFFYLLDEEEKKTANYPLLFVRSLCSYFGIQPSCRKKGRDAYFDMVESAFVSYPPEHELVLKEPITTVFAQILAMDSQSLIEKDIEKGLRQKLLYSWVDYYKIHLDYFKGLKSLEVLNLLFG